MFEFEPLLPEPLPLPEPEPLLPEPLPEPEPLLEPLPLPLPEPLLSLELLLELDPSLELPLGTRFLASRESVR